MISVSSEYPRRFAEPPSQVSGQYISNIKDDSCDCDKSSVKVIKDRFIVADEDRYATEKQDFSVAFTGALYNKQDMGRKMAACKKEESKHEKKN